MTRTRLTSTLVVLAALTLLPGCEFFEQLGPYDEVPLTIRVRNATKEDTFDIRIVGPFSGSFRLGPGQRDSIRGTAKDGASFLGQATEIFPSGNRGEVNSARCTFGRATIRALEFVVFDDNDERSNLFYVFTCSL